MPDDIMRCFLEQLVECIDGMSDSLRYLLHYYQMNLEETREKECLNQKKDSGGETNRCQEKTE